MLNIRLLLRVGGLSMSALLWTSVHAEETRKFQLYVGHQLWANHAGQALPVVRLGEKEMVLEQEGLGISVPRGEAVLSRFKPNIRLSPTLVQIEGLATRRVWSQLDQNREFNMLMDDSMASLDRAVDAMDRANADAQVSSADRARADEARELAAEALATEENQWSEDMENLMGKDLDADAMERGLVNTLALRATLSCSTPIGPVQFVWFCRVVEEEDYRTRWRMGYATVPNVGPQAVTFSHQIAGFATGFELQDLHVAVFVDGEELATSRSERRFELDFDQARDYLVTTFRVKHRGETRAPEPISLLRPTGATAAGPAVRMLEPLIVRVDVNGNVQDVVLASAPERPSSAYLAVLKSWPFFPALFGGQPTTGEYQGTLADLIGL